MREPTYQENDPACWRYVGRSGKARQSRFPRKHPRTPRLAECPHYPIPPERPEKLQGPAVGALCLYQGRNDPAPMVVKVIERSYVWAPGERTGSRRYDLKVIARGPNGTRHLLVDDKDLTPIDPASTATLIEGMTVTL